MEPTTTRPQPAGVSLPLRLTLLATPGCTGQEPRPRPVLSSEAWHRVRRESLSVPKRRDKVVQIQDVLHEIGPIFWTHFIHRLPV